MSRQRGRRAHAAPRSPLWALFLPQSLARRRGKRRRPAHLRSAARPEFRLGARGSVGLAVLAVGALGVAGVRLSVGTVGEALAFSTVSASAGFPDDEAAAFSAGSVGLSLGAVSSSRPADSVPDSPAGVGVPPASKLAEPDSSRRELVEIDTLAPTGLSPKSIVFVPGGRFFAQNMMYNHTVSVFDRSLRRIATIPDTVHLDALGHPNRVGEYQGSPVEAAASSDGRYVYVSNYEMYGPGFDNPGDDICAPSGYDNSFVYRIDVAKLRIDQAIEVGAVPKFLALTPDGRQLFVANWCSYDVSVVDLASQREVARIPLGPYPRGIAMDAKRNRAYVAVMGSTDIAVIDLADRSVGWIASVGPAPRHLVMDPEGRWLYATLNSAGTVAKIDVDRRVVVDQVATGSQPRSLAIAADGAALYVVNYGSQTVAKVRASDFEVLQRIPVGDQPIGITYDPETHNVWVALYGGALVVYGDRPPDPASDR